MKKLICLVLVFVFLLCGCDNAYTEEDLDRAREEAFAAGYKQGYAIGADDQWEKDCEELLIDGRSIRDIETEVYREFGITPREAFNIVDCYEYDYTHDGYTWNEYQNAIEAMYYTACIFPESY